MTFSSRARSSDCWYISSFLLVLSFILCISFWDSGWLKTKLNFHYFIISSKFKPKKHKNRRNPAFKSNNFHNRKGKVNVRKRLDSAKIFFEIKHNYFSVKISYFMQNINTLNIEHELAIAEGVTNLSKIFNMTNSISYCIISLLTLRPSSNDFSKKCQTKAKVCFKMLSFLKNIFSIVKVRLPTKASDISISRSILPRGSAGRKFTFGKNTR